MIELSEVSRSVFQRCILYYMTIKGKFKGINVRGDDIGLESDSVRDESEEAEDCTSCKVKVTMKFELG